MPEPPATQHVDVGIVIALPEELREVLALAGSYARHPAADLDTYLFTRGAYRCAVTLIGEMGETQAGMFTERLIATLDPSIILSMGIAGGLNDLMAGDVHVPSQAAQYIQDAKAAPAAGGGFSIVPGAPAYRADFALIKAVRAFEFDHPAAHKKWVADGAADLVELLPDAGKRAALVAEKQVRGDVRLLADGHVATGPVVGTAKAFSDWIRTHDRNVKSLEMEAAAVLLAAQTRTEPKRALAIRAISDFGDEHKKELDQKGDGVLRGYAMRNAVRLLWALLDAEALPLHPR
jgi:nucleoside phosphorylase